MMTVETDNTPGVRTERKLSSTESVEGVYPVNKPEGVSSFRMVQLVRKALGVKKVGHTGTLDPFASGVLVICVGRPATKLISCLMEGDKEYEATLQLGVITETQDPEGRVIEERPVPEIPESSLAECLERFTGTQMQRPPRYSALKHNGKPLYYYARKGIKVEKEPRQIRIAKLECLSRTDDTLTLKVLCSKGTYIRTLAADIGEFFGCGAHLSKLKRTRNGFFSIENSLPGEKLFVAETAGPLLNRYRMDVESVRDLFSGKKENN